MGNFAVIICDDRDYGEEEKLDLLRKIKLLYQRIFFTNVLKNIEALRYELYENTVLFTVRLPYKLNELCMINRARTERFITELAAQNDIRTSIIPDKLQDKLGFKDCTRVSAYSRYLFFSLLRHIVEAIIGKRGKKPYDLDITIISGDNKKNLRAIIEYIAPYIRFLTVARSNSDTDLSDLDELLEDYGMSALVTDNLRGALRDASVILNLAQLDDNFLSNVKVSPNSVIINYGTIAGKGFREGSLINGFRAALPSEINRSLDKRIFNFIGPTELSEAIIGHKLGIDGSMDPGQLDTNLMNRIQKEFVSGKFAVKAFLVRHGLLELKDF